MHRLLQLVLTIGTMLLWSEPCYGQSIFPDLSTPTFKPYGSLSVSATRSLLKGDTLNPAMEGFIAYPAFGPVGTFATGRLERESVRIFSGLMFAPHEQLQLGAGYGREIRFPKDCARLARGGYYNYYGSCENGRTSLSSTDVGVAFLDTHDQKNQLLLRAEYGAYNSGNFGMIYPDQAYAEPEKFWYDVLATTSLIGNRNNGVAIGLEARRHQGTGGRLDLNRPHFQTSLFAGWDNEKALYKNGAYKGPDNRLVLTTKATLRF